MKLTQVADAFRVCEKSKAATLCLVGVSGSGKTSIWKQVYEELGFEGYVILRPALLADAADLVGLPEFELVECGGKAVKTTAFMRPKWLPMDGQKILVVVDEINRVTKDVANALFGLIESEKPFIGEYELPEACRVVATCNPPTDNYAGVLDFADSAWTSRLCFVKIAPDLETYTNYGRETGTVSPVMLDFLNKQPKFFGTSGDFEVDMFFQTEGPEETNTRSLSKASSIEQTAKDLGVNRNITFELIRGIKGKEFATAFLNHVDTYSTVVTVDDLLTDSTAHERFDYTAISNISKILDDLKFKAENDEISTEGIDNVIPFLTKIPLDTLKGFVMWLIHTNNGKAKNPDFLVDFADKLFDEEGLYEKLGLLEVNNEEKEGESSEDN